MFRCRWCERGYCEDCLDWDKTDLVGENLTEYELLGFPAVTQAFYIRCPNCSDHHMEDHEARDFCENMALEYQEQHNELMAQKTDVDVVSAEEEFKKGLLPPSRDESMTDATTLDESGMSTPQVECLGAMLSSSHASKPKRKAAPGSFRAAPTKRSQRILS